MIIIMSGRLRNPRQAPSGLGSNIIPECLCTSLVKSSSGSDLLYNSSLYRRKNDKYAEVSLLTQLFSDLLCLEHQNSYVLMHRSRYNNSVSTNYVCITVIIVSIHSSKKGVYF